MISLNSLMKFGFNTCKLTFFGSYTHFNHLFAYDISCDVYGYIDTQGRKNIDTHE